MSVFHAAAPPWRCDRVCSDAARFHAALDRLPPIHQPSPASQTHQKSGPFPPPELTGFGGTTTPSASRSDRFLAASLRPLPSARTGLPRLRVPLSRRAVPTTPVDRRRCICRLLLCPCCLPRSLGGSASTTSLSRPAQASHTLRPVDSLPRPRRGLSQGFDGAGYPATPPASYRANRPLPGWDLHPQG